MIPRADRSTIRRSRSKPLQPATTWARWITYQSQKYHLGHGTGVRPAQSFFRGSRYSHVSLISRAALEVPGSVMTMMVHHPEKYNVPESKRLLRDAKRTGSKGFPCRPSLVNHIGNGSGDTSSGGFWVETGERSRWIFSKNYGALHLNSGRNDVVKQPCCGR